MSYYLDYSAGPITGQAIKNAGYGGVLRYVTAPELMQPPNPGNPKHYTRQEYISHLDANLDIWLVYQGNTTDADGGYSTGRRNAQRALDGCNSIKGPTGYDDLIFFTNDRTSLPSPDSWRAYLDGAASVLGINRVGAYGFGNAMDAAIGHASKFWQAGSRSQVRSYVHFWQDNNTQVFVDGIRCDRNLVLKELYPAPPISEIDMQLDDVVGQVNGASFTVKDVLSKLYKIPPVDISSINTMIEALQYTVVAIPGELGSLIRDKIGELEALILTANGQATWGDLATVTWGDVQQAAKKWGNL